MRRAFAPLLLALAIVSPLLAQSAASSGPTTRYSRLYVFGDSYSDVGAGYIDGNGPTAVAYLGWLMGLEVASSKALNAAGKSLVFAVSGAGTGEGTGRQVKEAFLGYGMMNQVRDFTARVKSGEIVFDPQTTLFFLAGGLNDGRQETATTLANLRQQLQILREHGARHFTIALLPTKIPQFAAVGRRLNPAYEQFVGQEAAAGARSVAEPLGCRIRRGDGASSSSRHRQHDERMCRAHDFRSGSNSGGRSGDVTSSTMKVTPRQRCTESWGKDSSRRSLPEPAPETLPPRLTHYLASEEEGHEQQQPMSAWTVRLVSASGADRRTRHDWDVARARTSSRNDAGGTSSRVESRRFHLTRSNLRRVGHRAIGGLRGLCSRHPQRDSGGPRANSA